ncbi:MAG: polymer-forming cytoskeletal protein [Patescibacteria group bacterium]|nr:MAG: polymer-forming cytoskeletal protein [Patescibacteria group bacterium]
MLKTRLFFLASFALSLVALFYLAPSAEAVSFRSGDIVNIDSGQTVSESLYVVASTLTVDGKVEGDLICAADSLTVNGEVTGDIICVGSTIVINGQVGGNLRLFGSTLTLGGQIEKNTSLGAMILSFTSNSEIKGDLLYWAATSDLRGKVGRDIDGYGTAVTVAGEVGRNLYLFSDRVRANKKNDNTPGITLESGVVVGGNFGYSSGDEPVVEEGVSIAGETIRHEFKMGKDKAPNPMAWVWWKVLSIFSALVIGLVLVIWLDKPLRKIDNLMFSKSNPALGWGLFALIIIPLIAIVLLFTIIGIPLALVTAGLWFLAVYLAKIITAIVVGQRIMKKYLDKAENDKKSLPLFWPMVVGIVVCYLIFAIPVIGWAASFLATVWGLGGIWMYGKSLREKQP